MKTKEEIREIYPPRECESQVEFDQLMVKLNFGQSQINHPLLDREEELVKKIMLLRQQILGINVQINSLAIERQEVKRERKDVNRIFHELKHELIQLNPLEKFHKEEHSEEV